MNSFYHSLRILIGTAFVAAVVAGCQSARRPAAAQAPAAPAEDATAVQQQQAQALAAQQQAEAARLQEQAQRRAAEAKRQEEAVRLAAEEAQKQEQARREAEQRLAAKAAKKEQERQAALAAEAQAQKALEERQAAERAAEARARDEQAAAAADAAAAAQAATVLAPAPTVALATISGMITVSAKGKASTYNEAIVALEPVNSAQAADQAAATHVIDMKDKRFSPKLHCIRVGDTVKFRNYDPFLHNVFSLSGDNKFDLGTYGKGTEPEHRFEHPGIVKTYCNIHPDMVCFIYCSAGSWNTVTGNDGRYELGNVPPGDYKLTAWSARGQREEMLSIQPGEHRALNIEIDASTYKAKPHLNKLGEKYKAKTLDESY